MKIPTIIHSIIGTNPLLNVKQTTENFDTAQIPTAEGSVNKQLNIVKNCSKSQSQTDELNTSSEIPNTNFLLNSDITDAELNSTGIFSDTNKIFDNNAIKKFFEIANDRLLNFAENIDKQITFYLSKEKIKECFIYGIFFDEHLLVKEEFLFLIFIVPEMEVITRIYGQLKEKNFNVDLFDDNLQDYKEEVKKIILGYKNILEAIKENNVYAYFNTIEAIIDYFILNLKEYVDNFRISNYKILNPIFGDCHCFKYYDFLIKYASKAKSLPKQYRLFNSCFIAFLNQDWISKLSNELSFFNNIEFYSGNFKSNFAIRDKLRTINLFKNLNVFVELSNRIYFANSDLSICEYDYKYVKYKNQYPYLTLIFLKNGTYTKDKLPLC